MLQYPICLICSIWLTMSQWLQPDTGAFCAHEAVLKCCCRCSGLILVYKHITGRGGKVGVVRERGRTADDRPSVTLLLMTLDFQEPATTLASVRTGVEARISVNAVATMLVTRLEGPSMMAACLLGPFRWHQITIFEIITAILHCLLNGRLVGMCAFV